VGGRRGRLRVSIGQPVQAHHHLLLRAHRQYSKEGKGAVGYYLATAVLITVTVIINASYETAVSQLTTETRSVMGCRYGVSFLP
jgi:hypothetical protein